MHGNRNRVENEPCTSRTLQIIQPYVCPSFSFVGNDLNDGLWHSVNINARRTRITLTLDNEAASPAPDTSRLQIYSGNSYYFGGKFCYPCPLRLQVDRRWKRHEWLFHHMHCQLGYSLPAHTHTCMHTCRRTQAQNSEEQKSVTAVQI